MKIDKPEIRLAMLGMIEGNGHPYSWSAIVNGYNPDGDGQVPLPGHPAIPGRGAAQHHAHSRRARDACLDR